MTGDQRKVTAAVVQASPVFLDAEGTAAKAARLIGEAGDRGARIIAFPEAFIPTFPYWPRALPYPKRSLSIDAYVALWRESVLVPGPVTEVLGAAARAAGAFVSVGVTEREERNGTLYNTLLYFGPDGALVARHRKMMPTFEERCVWGQGDGRDLEVAQTPWGRVGGLICGNNVMTLPKYHLLQQGEQIHVAVWPCRRGTHGLQDAACRGYAVEGQTFVLSAGGVLHPEEVPDDFPLKAETEWAIGGGSAILDPFGRYLVGPVYDREEILVAELDLDDIIRAKANMDGVGHYAAPPRFRLIVDD